MTEFVEKDIKSSMTILHIFKKEDKSINVMRREMEEKKDPNIIFRDEIYNS